MDLSIFDQVILGNAAYEYLYSAAMITGGFILAFIIKIIVLSRVRAFISSTDTDIDDQVLYAIEKNLMPLLYYGVLYVSITGLKLHQFIDKALYVAGIVLAVFYGAKLLVSLILFFIRRYWRSKGVEEEKSNTIVLLGTIIKVIIWSIALIILLDNLGVKISGLIAGLGIGGVAIAFAAQAILGDVFNYFTIFFDRPFEIGDFIIVDQYLGVVEHIGIKSTRIRSLSGEQLVFSNTDLTGSRLRNYKRMYERRISFEFGVTYQTTANTLEKIPGVVQEIIENIEQTRFDRAHFASFGDFSLVFEVVYYVLNSDYAVYRDIQQEINLEIKRRLEKMGVEFAFPTQTLYVQKMG
mgnify:CR=1 FL=1